MFRLIRPLLYLLPAVYPTVSPLLADNAARLTRPSYQPAAGPSATPAAQEPYTPAPFVPYAPPPAAAGTPALPQGAPVAPAQPGHGAHQPHYVPGGGLVTQVQGRTDGADPTPVPSPVITPAPAPQATFDQRTVITPGEAGAQPYAPARSVPAAPSTGLPVGSPAASPTPYDLSIESARPAALTAPAPSPTPAPAAPQPAARATTPTSTVPPPVVYRFSLEQTFRDLAARKEPIPVNIWFPGVPSPGNREVALGSAIAQGIALRCGHNPIIATSSPSILPGHFNIVVGLPEELRGMITESDIPAGSHGRLILRDVSQHTNTQLLFVTGRTEEGISSAILSLGLARAQLPSVPTASIREVVLPHAPPFMRREPVRGDAIHTFNYLHENGTGIYRTNSGGLRIEMNLPGDFDHTMPGDIILNLHTSASAQYGSAQIIARVNDHQEMISVPLGAGTATDSHTTIPLPLKLFRIGENVIEINLPGAASRGIEVFGDSTLSTPRCTTPPTLPNLFLINRTGYPLIGQPDGSEILVLLAGRSAETVGSTWTLLAKLAQVSNTMFHATEYASTTDADPPVPRGRHVIVVGSERNLPEELQKELPPDLFKVVVAAPVAPEEVRGMNLKDLLDQTRKKLFTKVAAKPTPTPSPSISKDQLYPRKERGFLACAPPVEEVRGWLLLLSAETEPLLYSRTGQVVQRSYWNHLTGSSVYWNQLPDTLEVYKPTPPPSSAGRAIPGLDNWVEMPFGERYLTENWLYAIGITLLVLIVTLIKSLRKNSNLRDYTS